MIFYFHANKTYFHKKGFALSLIYRVRVFVTRKWSVTVYTSTSPLLSYNSGNPVTNNRKITAMRNLSFPPIFCCTKWRHAWARMVDCEQPLFFFRFSKGSARARERWAAKPRNARNEYGSLVSRLQSRAWSFTCLGRLRDGKRKKRDCS